MSSHSPILSLPPELVDKWFNQSPYINPEGYIATQAAQWGADMELEACVEWLDRNSPVIGGFHLRIDRRPQPPSLKEQALETLNWMESEASYDKPMIETIRKALEALDD